MTSVIARCTAINRSTRVKGKVDHIKFEPLTGGWSLDLDVPKGCDAFVVGSEYNIDSDKLAVDLAPKGVLVVDKDKKPILDASGKKQYNTDFAVWMNNIVELVKAKAASTEGCENWEAFDILTAQLHQNIKLAGSVSICTTTDGREVFRRETKSAENRQVNLAELPVLTVAKAEKPTETAATIVLKEKV